METNNVYAGPDGLRKYFDPDFAPPIPLVELPECLNPMRGDGVRIYAKMMSTLPANNVKELPALNLLETSVPKAAAVPGRTRRVVEYSSGSTVISMSMVARAFHGVDDTRAYLSNKTSAAKLRLMQFFGLRLRLFGGPSQPEPNDPRGGIQAARRDAETSSGEVVNPNQYENPANWTSHYRWTGPQLKRQLPHMNVFCAGMGTSGTMTGTGTYLRHHMPRVTRVGCCTAAGQRVPGPRSLALMSPVEFPWRDAVDVIEEVEELPSYAWSLRLSREGLVCGPSSGFNLQGLLSFLGKRKAAGTLQELAGEDGEIHCVFLCCDLPYQYIDEYFTKLGESYFHPIENQSLTRVDLHRYDEAWELPVEEVVTRYFTAPVGTPDVAGQLKLDDGAVALDLRKAEDFAKIHLPGSVNLPLETLNANTGSPFYNPHVLERQWTELEGLFASTERLQSIGLDQAKLTSRSVVVVCYDGDTSRVATSVFRSRGIQACSLKDGVRGLDSGLELVVKGGAAQSIATGVSTP